MNVFWKRLSVEILSIGFIMISMIEGGIRMLSVLFVVIVLVVSCML